MAGSQRTWLGLYSSALTEKEQENQRQKRQRIEMASHEVYLDNSATTRVFPEVVRLMDKIYLEEYGNPSSMHHKGVEAEQEIRGAKEIFSRILKCQPKNLYFTSCGSESDNIAIIGGALANGRQGKHLVTTRIEHQAVLESMRYLESQGFEVTYLPVDADGHVSAEQVADAVREDTILVSIMFTNNEIGAVEPIAEIGAAIKRKNPHTLFHVDAVQAFGKEEILPHRMHIDFLAASGHKIHSPKGIGLLYVADGVKVRNLIFGGGQQNGLRSGTENVAGIAGMALAADMLYKDLPGEREKLFGFKEHFILRMKELENVRINGIPALDLPKPGARAIADVPEEELGESIRTTAPQVISLTVPGVRAEVLLHALEDKKIYVSSGSACSSNRPHLSETLRAIGVTGEELDNTIRLSTSVMNTMDDMDAAADALLEIVPMLRRYTRQ